MLPRMNISASIVAYKNPAPVIRQAIQSFLDGTDDSRLFIIDNSPTDELRNLATDPRIVYVFNQRNAGYGAAHNVALREARRTSAYHLVLNPDVYFDAGVIATLYRFMETHPDVGLIMPKVLHPDGRLQYLCKLLPTPRTLILRSFLNFLTPIVRKENYQYELQFADYDTIMDVPFLSGCFMFLRTSVLAKSGLFDERFFLYAEDVDLSRRIQQHARTVYFPGATIYHRRDLVSGDAVNRMLHKIRSVVQYFNKWGWFSDEERDRINEQILRSYMGG